MVYSLDYMKGDSGLTRYWFFMNFFIGSMQLIVLSDNLLSLFIGWEGVGLCSYALIGYYYHDEKENWVGTPGSMALGEEQAYPPSHAGHEGLLHDQGRRHRDAGGHPHPLHLLRAPSTTSSSSPRPTGPCAREERPARAGGPADTSEERSASLPSSRCQEWLPDAMAGPAPVSALIHAATMVNAGRRPGRAGRADLLLRARWRTRR